MPVKILDGEVPTLDASQLTYEIEKARIKGITGRDNLLKAYSSQEDIAMPSSFTYVDSFYDHLTGTSGAAFKDVHSGQIIIAYTGTNPDSNLLQDVISSDGVGIAFGTGHYYGPAYRSSETSSKRMY